MSNNGDRLSKWKETEIGLIPEEWSTLRIKDLTETIFSGGTPDTRKPEYWGGGLPWLSSGETGHRFIYNTEKTITEVGVENSSTRLAKTGDIVIASAGQGYTRGQTSLCMIDTYINQSIIAIRAKNNIINQEFLFYYLSSKYGLLRNISDSNSSRGSLTTKLLAEIGVPVPPLPEQRSIAKILSDFDSKVELNNQMNNTLEAMVRAIFKHWFTDFEFPNEEGKPYKSSGGEMIDSEVGKIPKGWRVGKLGEYTNIIKGRSYKSTDLKRSKIALVTLKSFNRGGGFNQDGYKEYVGEYDEEQVLGDGEIIVAQTDITQKAEVIGRPALVSSLGKYSKLIASLDLQIVRPKEDLSHNYVYYLLSTEDFKNHALSYTNGTTVLHLNRNAVPEYLAVIPSKTILGVFDKIVNILLDKISSNSKEIVTLSKLRDSLLPKLMSGKIKVKGAS